MNQEESIALWRKGKDAWTAWAEDMLHKQTALEGAGLWKVDRNGKGETHEARDWVEAAKVDLSGLRLMTRTSPPESPDPTLVIVEGDVIGFDGFVFPWHAMFRGALFSGEARFVGAQFHGPTDFEGVQFHGQTDFGLAQFWGESGFESSKFHQRVFFYGAQFHKQARFWNARFERASVFGNAQFQEAAFEGAQFLGEAVFFSAKFRERVGFLETQFNERAAFQDAQFHGDADFTRTMFKEQADFGRAQFHSAALFLNAKFHEAALFLNAQFRELAWFANSNFESSAIFRDARFGSEEKPHSGDFTAIKADRAFDLTNAQFTRVPAFNQADFKQAPDLGDVTYPQPPFFRFYVKRLEPNPEYGKPNESKKKEAQRYAAVKVDAAKYRHLRRLAILGYDHENEVRAFKGETRAKRGTEHLPWHAAFWFGLGYDLFSDFGRSMMRPFYAGAVLTMLFAGVYLLNAGYAPNQWWSACPTPSQATLMSKALSLSFGNALPVVASARGEETKAIYTCLYGGADKGGVFPIPPGARSCKGRRTC